MSHKDSDGNRSIVQQLTAQSDHGEIPPVYLKNGPNTQRHCTNPCFCAIFLILFGGVCYLWVEAFLNGNVSNIEAPMDADGNLCGVGALATYPFIYFVTPDPDFLYRTVCLSQCPTDVQTPSNYSLLCHPNSVVTSCSQNSNPANLNQEVLIYNTVQIGKTICAPVDPHDFQIVHPQLVIGDFEQAISNIRQGFPIIAAAAGITFILALVFTCLLTFFTTCITWIFLIIYIIFTGLLGTAFFYQFMDKPIPYLQKAPPPAYVEYQRFLLLGAAEIFWVLCLVAFLTVLLNFNRIKFMIGIVKLATQFVRNNKSILLVPLIMFQLLMALIGVWLVSTLYIVASQRVTIQPGQHVYPFQRLIPTVVDIGKIILDFNGLIWLRIYCLNLAHYITAGTSALWYYRANENKKANNSLLWQVIKTALGQHNGSIAAGAIYLFFFEPMSIVFNFIYVKEIKTYNNKYHISKYKYRMDNLCMHYFTNCCLFCCCCCENWIMYINKQAYTEVFLLSTDFCQGSRAAHYTMKRNNQDFALSGLGDSFTHFGKMFLFLISTFGCCAYMLIFQKQLQIDAPIYPAILIGFVSLSTSTLFMDIFGQSADSILLTYFTDIEVEKYHFGREESGSCPDDIRATVHHLRYKNKQYQQK